VQDEKGISLVELVVAMGIGGIATLAFLSMMQYESNGAASVRAGFDFDTLVTNVRVGLQAKQACNKTFPTGTNLNGGSVTTVFQPDATTVLANDGGQYLSVFNTHFVLNDLGSVDTLSPYNLEHIGALTISGTRGGAGGTAAGLTMQSTVYVFLTASASSPGTVDHCSRGGGGMVPNVQTFPPATGGGTWLLTRAGDSIPGSAGGNARPGTIDIWRGYGSGTNSSPPPSPFPAASTNFFIQQNLSSWAGLAYYVW
jgi:hypothetical protein